MIYAIATLLTSMQGGRNAVFLESWHEQYVTTTLQQLRDLSKIVPGYTHVHG